MRHKFATVLIFYLLCSASYTPALFAQPTLTRHTIDSNLQAAYWVHPEDIDGDGDLDLATASFDGLSWYENDGNENFQKHFLGSAVAAWSVFAKDLDNDGDVDVLGGSTADKEIVWFENKGSQFVRHVLEQNWQDPESVFAADFDGDGDNDILSCAVNDDLVAWWENNGGGSFSKHIIDNLSRAHTIYATDLNGDGNIDVIGGGSSQIRWYSNDGAGNFTKKTVAGGGAWGVSAADIDGDGDQDILRTQRDNGDVDWFENDGTGTFSEHLIESAYGESWSVVAGDVDADGDLDVSAAGFAANTITLWLNNGGGSFSPGIVVDSVSIPRGVNIVDLDEDGDADIVAAIREDRDVAWYEVVGTVFQNITIDAPAPGDSLLANSMFEIGWTSTGSIASTRIEFSADAGTTWSDIIATVPNNGSYAWGVPDTSSALSLIRISDADDNAPSETLSGPFTIFRESELPQSITLLTPHAGQELNVDSTFVITWTTAGAIDSVGIDFSSDNGGAWTALVASTPNDGQYSWTIPDAESDSSLIRIYDVADGSPADTSDLFTVLRFVPPPTVTLLSPNGGEELFVDSTFTITWSSTGEPPVVRIEFSDDDGVTWSDVVSGAENTGSFDWTVPNSETTTGLIRISEPQQGAEDVSDSTFSVIDLAQFLPVINAFSPFAGPPGTEVSITGTNLLDVFQVTFNGVAADFVSVAPESLTAFVPQLATTGPISVITSVGPGASLADFEVRANPDTVLLEFLPSDDAQVKLTEVTKNFGDKTSFKVENNKFVSYLKFQPVGLPAQLLSAEIQCYALAGSQSGGSMTLVSNFLRNSTTPWTEDTVRANNAPLVEGSVLSTAGAIAIGDTATFDVLSAVVGDGTYSFAITSSSPDLVQYASKEAIEKPMLVIKALTFGNLPPIAIDDVVVFLEDDSVSLDIISNDVDPDGGLDSSSSVTILNQPVHVSVSVQSGVLTITPETNFFGEDSLTYQVADDQGAVSNAATVRLTILSVNDPPVAQDDSAATLTNQPIEVPILLNDVDIDGTVEASTVQFEREAMPGASTEFDASTGLLTYVPPPDYSGIDTLSYIVQDDSGAVSNGALIRIYVQQTNRPPVIQSFLPETLEFDFSPGDTILFTAETVDDDNDSLTMQWSLADPVSGSGTLVSTSNSYEMHTGELAQTSYVVRFEVSDGQQQASMEWHLDLVTSVELSTFQAQFVGFAGVEITWTTSREVDNSGFNVLRSLSVDGNFERANQEKIRPVAKGRYQFVDKTVRVGGRYFYLIEDVDANGNVSRHGPISVEIKAPKSFSMAPNFPNPFNPETKIHFEVPKSGTVLLRIFDTLGREVRTLVNGRKDAGFHEIAWDARDDLGRGVASGIYFYQISYEGHRVTRRMLLVR